MDPVNVCASKYRSGILNFWIMLTEINTAHLLDGQFIIKILMYKIFDDWIWRTCISSFPGDCLFGHSAFVRREEAVGAHHALPHMGGPERGGLCPRDGPPRGRSRQSQEWPPLGASGQEPHPGESPALGPGHFWRLEKSDWCFQNERKESQKVVEEECAPSVNSFFEIVLLLYYANAAKLDCYCCKVLQD